MTTLKKPQLPAERVTDLNGVKKLFRRPKVSPWVHLVGDDKFFEQLQESIAESGAILKGHFKVEEDE